jgi:hypothetical protein
VTLRKVSFHYPSKRNQTSDVYYCSFNSIYPWGIHTFDLLEHPFATWNDPWKNDQLLIRSVHYFRCLFVTRDFFLEILYKKKKKLHVMIYERKSTSCSRFFFDLLYRLFRTYQYSTWDSFNAWIDFWNLS